MIRESSTHAKLMLVMWLTVACPALLAADTRTDIRSALESIGGPSTSLTDREAAGVSICQNGEATDLATVFASLDDLVPSPWAQDGVRLGFDPDPIDEVVVPNPDGVGSARMVVPSLPFLSSQFGFSPKGEPGIPMLSVSNGNLATGVQIARIRRDAFLCLVRTLAETQDLAPHLVPLVRLIESEFQAHVWVEAAELSDSDDVHAAMLDVCADDSASLLLRRRAVQAVTKCIVRTYNLQLRDKLLTVVFASRKSPFADTTASLIPTARADARLALLMMDVYEERNRDGEFSSSVLHALKRLEKVVGSNFSSIPLDDLRTLETDGDHPAVQAAVAWVSANKAQYEAEANQIQAVQVQGEPHHIVPAP